MVSIMSIELFKCINDLAMYIPPQTELPVNKIEKISTILSNMNILMEFSRFLPQKSVVTNESPQLCESSEPPISGTLRQIILDKTIGNKCSLPWQGEIKHSNLEQCKYLNEFIFVVILLRCFKKGLYCCAFHERAELFCNLHTILGKVTGKQTFCQFTMSYTTSQTKLPISNVFYHLH